MSFIDDTEKSVEMPCAVETYKFWLSDVPDVWCDYTYTSHFKSIAPPYVDEYTYIAQAIERSEYSISTGMNPVSMTIVIPSTSTLVMLLNPASGEIPELCVEVGRWLSLEHMSEKPYEVLFVGELVSVSFSDGVCSMTFNSILRLLDNLICRTKLQALCNNVLGDVICTKDALFGTRNVTPAGRTLTISLPPASELFTLGKIFIPIAGQWRFITRHYGSSWEKIDVNRTFYGIGGGVPRSAQLYMGCDRLPTTCLNKFNNLDNFNGMPYIPLKDPTESAITNKSTGD